MQWSLIKNVPGITSNLNIWHVDSADDISVPSPDAQDSAPGSLAFTADGSKRYRKSNTGEYVEIKTSSNQQEQEPVNMPVCEIVNEIEYEVNGQIKQYLGCAAEDLYQICQDHVALVYYGPYAINPNTRSHVYRLTGYRRSIDEQTSYRFEYCYHDLYTPTFKVKVFTCNSPTDQPVNTPS